MRAGALAEWWKERGGIAKIIHPIDNACKLYNFGVEMYNFIQKKAPRFHYLYFHFLEYAGLHRSQSRIMGKDGFVKNILQYEPNLIVSVHAHLNHGYFEIASRISRKKFKFIIFCGELSDGIGFSSHWINPTVDLLVTQTEESKNAAIRRGMPKKKVLQSEFLLRKPFYQQNIGCNFKELDGENFVLLATGANGANQHIKICQKLIKINFKTTIVALCGNNKILQKNLLELANRYQKKIIPLPYQTAEEMTFLMRNAICCIGRPGAGLTAEAIASGTPMIFDVIGGVMPQEWNSLNFWKQKCGKLNTLNCPNRIHLQLQKEIPSIKILISNSPRKLLDQLFHFINIDA